MSSYVYDIQYDLTKKSLLNLENQAKFELHNTRSEEYLDLLKQIRVDSIDVQDQVGKCNYMQESNVI
jgi:hypothetical protein